MSRQLITVRWGLLIIVLVMGLVLLVDKNQQQTEQTSTVTASLDLPTAPPTENAPYDKNFPLVRLAWFTNIPREEDMFRVVEWFDLYIFHQGNEKDRDLMVALGARGTILQYILFESIEAPDSCTAKPKLNQAAYLPGDYCNISEQHPDWFLLDTEGQRILVQDGDTNLYLMDPGNSGWRSFFLDRIKEIQAEPNWDGVFLDNVPVTLAFREQSGHLPAAYPDDTSYQAAVQGFLKYLYENYFQANKKLAFANLVSRKDDADWVSQLNYLDGAMHEGWAIDWPDGYRPVDIWEKQMVLAEQTQEMGKTIVMVSQGNQDDKALQNFAFASYLLINHGSAFFRYANSDDYADVWLYENYAYDLGEPMGARYQDGQAWKRDFTRGNVFVNPETHQVEINIK
ncbi:MAG: putative glycoside hydrolase [Anaerolineales bacterium]